MNIQDVVCEHKGRCGVPKKSVTPYRIIDHCQLAVLKHAIKGPNWETIACVCMYICVRVRERERRV